MQRMYDAYVNVYKGSTSIKLVVFDSFDTAPHSASGRGGREGNGVRQVRLVMDTESKALENLFVDYNSYSRK